ncbi:MAG: 2'-5' RNA ligase family protein [Anaerolineales bacterium]
MHHPPLFEKLSSKHPDLQAVVSILDEAHCTRVESLWEELDREFGVHGVYITPIPHFSYQVAEGYGQEALQELLEDLAARHAPFTIHTSGLGLFTGPDPTLYVPVVRSLDLTHFHQSLWEAISGVAQNIIAHYDPQSWFPHITLTQDGADAETLGAIFQRFSQREFNWEIDIDNVALICDTCGKRGVKYHFTLKG